MSPAMTAFHSVGITQSVLILGVLFIAAAVVIGMYWRIILPGAMFLAVATLFIGTSEPTVETAKVEKPVEVVASKVENSAPPKVEFDEHEAYIKDCMEIAEYSKKKCENLWTHREDEEPKVAKKPLDTIDESELKLLDVSNKEYKARRAAALKKPGAVVGHVTYH